MPAFLFPLIAKFLALVVASLVFRALVSLGFAYFVYTGIGSVVTTIESYVHGLFSSVPADVVHIFALARVDVAINIVISAFVARLSLAGMDKVTGTITAMAVAGKAL